MRILTISFFIMISIYSMSKDINRKIIGSSLTSTFSSALSGADVALTKSIINPNHLKGEYGETIVGKFYLEKQLRSTGNWRSISPRIGRTGIDLISIKYDAKGTPIDLMVGEVKYGGSKLGITKDGIQLGNRWVQKRIIAMGNRYIQVGKNKNIKVIKRSSKFKNYHTIDISLSKGRKGVFWRNNSKDSWKYDGRSSDLKNAKKQIIKQGKFLKSRGTQMSSIKKRLFKVNQKNNVLEISIIDGKFIEKGIHRSEAVTGKIKVNMVGKNKIKSKKILVNEISKKIKSKFRHFSDDECIVSAKKIVENQSGNISNSRISLLKQNLNASFKAGVAGGVITLGISLIEKGINRGNYSDAFIDGGVGFVSVGIGTFIGRSSIQKTMSKKASYAFISKAASSIGISNPILTNSLGGAIGGIVTSVMFSGLEFVLGRTDVKGFTINTLIGSTASVVGATTGVGVLSAVGSYGVAGTGTAISSLSGAAANSASLAYLGGGTVASGGGGITAGTAVLGGVVTVAVIATSITLAYGLSKYNEKQNEKFMSLLFQECKKRSSFIPQANRKYRLISF